MLMTTWEEKYRTVLGWKGLERELNLNQTKQTNQKEGVSGKSQKSKLKAYWILIYKPLTVAMQIKTSN